VDPRPDSDQGRRQDPDPEAHALTLSAAPGP
jgi:hypothetical protein